MEPWRLEMEPWKVSNTVADLHHYDEEQDPDPHQSENSYPDPQNCLNECTVCVHTRRYRYWRLRNLAVYRHFLILYGTIISYLIRCDAG